MRILGIDPGLASTGAGVIERRGDVWRLLHCCEVRTSSSTPLPRRLRSIHELIEREINDFEPQAVAVESLFFAKNVRSAVMMAHGRGAALLAAAGSNVPVHEYSPLEIKQSVVGKGRASKGQVMQMVKVLLGLPNIPTSDHQADALACALAHAYRSRLQERIIAESETLEDIEGISAISIDSMAEAKALLAKSRNRKRRR